MTSKLNAKQPRAAKGAVPPAPPMGNPHSPSVPISLYREVSTELQSANRAMESLKLQNQQLLEQNQKLRIEIERVVQSALQLRQIADSDQVVLPTAPAPLPDLEVHFDPPPVSRPAAQAKADVMEFLPEPPSPKPMFTEQEPQLRATAPKERSSDVGGWWLMVVICLIVVTAFGTGFLIVRPLLPQR